MERTVVYMLGKAGTGVAQRKAITWLQFSRFLSRMFYIVWFLSFSVLFYHTVKMYHRMRTILLAAVILYALGIGTLLVFRQFVDALSDRGINIFILCIMILMMLLLVKFGFVMCVPPFNDTGTAYYSAAEVLQNGHISTEVNAYTSCNWATHTSNHDYFLIYPNNTFLVFYQVCYYKLLSLFTPVDMYAESGYRAAVVLNAISITLAAGFGAVIAKKCKGNCAAVLYILSSAMFIPYYLHAYKAYSDTLSMPYITGAILCFILARKKDEKNQIDPYKMLLAGALLTLGILIKGSVLVVLVALPIYIFLQDHPIKKKLLYMAVPVLEVVVLISAWSFYMDHCSWLNTERADEYEFPSMHWIMMASIGSGDYRQSDFDYTQSFPTLEQRKEADTEEFLRRVSSYGSAANYLRFEVKKIAAVLADGIYAQSSHLKMTFSKVPWLEDWVTSDGTYYKLFYAYITIFITAFYLAFLAGAILGIIKAPTHESTLWHIILFGVLLFFAFWEFKSRYLLNFVPVFFLILIFSLVDVSEFLTEGLSRVKNFLKKERSKQTVTAQ